MRESGFKWPSALRLVATFAFVLLAGAQVVRTGIVRLEGGALSPAAQQLSSFSAPVLTSRIMTDVGHAASKGQEPGERTFEDLRLLANIRPLSSEPFLVHGAMAIKASDYVRAENLLMSARQRDPRSMAARYLLADLYLRTGRPLQAMTEMAVLNRFVPAASGQLAESLAAYASNRGSIPTVRAILASYPELETPLLARLSADPKNTDLILALASTKRGKGPPPDWQRLLLTTLIAHGEYKKAYFLWQKFSGIEPPPKDSLFNPTFTQSQAPPPFNWQLAEGTGGVAEPSSRGLQVLYFGRDRLALATQVILLSPGRFRVSMHLSGDVAPGSIHWKVTCLNSGRELLSSPILSAGVLVAEFVVPPGCPAQSLALAAEAQNLGDRADFHLGNLILTRVES